MIVQTLNRRRSSRPSKGYTMEANALKISMFLEHIDILNKRAERLDWKVREQVQEFIRLCKTCKTDNDRIIVSKKLLETKIVLYDKRGLLLDHYYQIVEAIKEAGLYKQKAISYHLECCYQSLWDLLSVLGYLS